MISSCGPPSSLPRSTVTLVSLSPAAAFFKNTKTPRVLHPFSKSMVSPCFLLPCKLQDFFQKPVFGLVVPCWLGFVSYSAAKGLSPQQILSPLFYRHNELAALAVFSCEAGLHLLFSSLFSSQQFWLFPSDFCCFGFISPPFPPHGFIFFRVYVSDFHVSLFSFPAVICGMSLMFTDALDSDEFFAVR